jgi:nitroreductase
MSDPVLRAVAGLRTTRRFLSRPVSPEDLARIAEAARWTGSARNRQPWRLVPLDDRAALVELSRLGAYAGWIAAAPLALLLALDHGTGGADAEFDGGRLAQSVMLAAGALGLGTCPVTLFPEKNAARATALAGLAPPWRVRTAIAVGHPDPAPPPPGRPAIPRGRMAAGDLVQPGTTSAPGGSGLKAPVSPPSDGGDAGATGAGDPTSASRRARPSSGE